MVRSSRRKTAPTSTGNLEDEHGVQESRRSRGGLHETAIVLACAPSSLITLVFTLRPTQKLARRLRLQIPTTMPDVQNYVADWCVQDFRAGPTRYLLFVNTPSLFPVIIHARGVNTVDRLIRGFAEGFKLSWEGTPSMKQFDRGIAAELATMQLGRVPGRSLLGSTNDFIRMAYFHLHEDGCSPAETSRALADAPMGYLGMNSPDRVFLKLNGQRRAQAD